MNPHPFTPEQFKEIYSKVPRLTVDLVVRMNGGIVLTLRDLPSWHGQWHLPGGTVLYKEKVEDAVKRVALDELGIEVSITKFLGYIEYPSEEKERGFGWSVGLAVECESMSADLRVNEQASRVEVFEKLPENLIFEQRVFLDKYI